MIQPTWKYDILSEDEFGYYKMYFTDTKYVSDTTFIHLDSFANFRWWSSKYNHILIYGTLEINKTNPPSEKLIDEYKNHVIIRGIIE